MYSSLRHNAFKTENNKLLLFNPISDEYLPINNVEDEFNETYKTELETPKEILFQKSFAERRKLTEKIADPHESIPVSGGVGFGFNYLSAFNFDFSKGSSIVHDTICPGVPGPGVTDDLYLTSTNRTAKGVEALIWYHSPTSKPSFWIYDWALPKPGFILGIRSLGNYLTYKVIHGDRYQVITIHNQTYEVDNDTWTNVVWLLNQTKSVWDQVYSYTYSATLSDQYGQKGHHRGLWGPIVETFQDKYADTNVFGYSATYLRSADINARWTDFQLLSDKQSYIRKDNKGFTCRFVDPNHTFCVQA